jgi:hypothetical protein
MKRFLSTLFVLSLTACGLTEVSVDGDIGEQGVPGDPLGGLLPGDLFQPIPLTIDVDAALAAQDLKVIKAVFLDKIVLNITPTNNQNGDDNFDFIDKIDIFASSEARPDLPRVLIGTLTRGNDGATTITIEGEDVDIKDYIEAGMDVETSGTGNAPATDTNFNGVVTVTVKAL